MTPDRVRGSQPVATLLFGWHSNMSQSLHAEIEALAERVELHSISIKVLGEAIQDIERKLDKMQQQIKEL
jgi:hypothetical protein